MFFKRTAALAAAAATALTLGTAAPAQATDSDDLARILFGALATGLLAQALNDRYDDNRDDHHYERNVTINRNYYGSRPPAHGHGHGDRTVTVSPGYGKFAVPASCQRRLKTQHGTRTYVGQPCLSGRGYNTANLPSACARNLDFGGRNVRAWGVSCLAGKGYRMK